MVQSETNAGPSTEYFDNTTRRLIDTYTEALWSAANKNGNTATVREEAQGLLKVLEGKRLIHLFFEGNGTSKDQRRELLHQSFDGKVDELLSNFVQVLNNHDRLYLLADVLASYQQLDDIKQGKVDVYVTTAVPLTSEQLSKLEGVIRNRLGKTPRSLQNTNPSILGGMIIRVGDMVWDESSKSKLSRLKQLLEEKGTHEIQAGRDRFRTAN